MRIGELDGESRSESALALDIVLRDEISHVGLGEAWYQRLCAECGLEPEATYCKLLKDFVAPWPQAPRNESAHLAAGFSAAELLVLAHTG